MTEDPTLGNSNDVASRLIARFRDTLNEQVKRTLARRIRSKVRDARSDPDRAARRWPFELIQNAHDAGPRDGRDGIAVAFELSNGVLRFSHDAAPFSIADIAALLTGGSSKDFDSSETTGRFGTGFLVTHSLSEHVQVGGILEVDGERRGFDVTLDRPDDEDLILRNMEASELALAETRVIEDITSRPTATAEYVVDDQDMALVGLRMLEHSLPYLLCSCRRLREIRIRRQGHESRWNVVASLETLDGNGVWIDGIAVRVVDEGKRESEWRVIRAAPSEGALGRLLLALRKDQDSWVASRPGEVSSVFRQLPLVGGPRLSAWVIIDGEFDVDQERSTVHVVGDQGQPLREAFDALGGLALLAVREGWVDGYRVAHLAMPSDGLGDKTASVWHEVLSSAATRLAHLPLVRTVRAGMRPALQTEEHDHWADFVSPPTGPAHAELWELAAACTNADPPLESESEGWSEIAQGWAALGVSVEWLDLPGIARRATSQAGEVAAMAIDGDPYEWLARYLGVLGKHWRATGITKAHVQGVLPDQNGKLRNFGELRRDGGVSERVKAIAGDVGLDLRAQLLNQRLVQALADHGLESGAYALHEATGDDLTEQEAIRNLVQHLSDALPADQPVPQNGRKVAATTISLFEHLWTSLGEDARDVAWDVPILAADGTARRAGLKRLMVPPVATWPEAARPFAAAYPDSRILADDYANVAGSEAVLEALASWGITHRGLLTISRREELRERALRVIAVDREVAPTAVLREAEFMQIALLEPEVINHCKQSRQQAQALLGLVVQYVAREDKSWRSTIEVPVRVADGESTMLVTPSLWLSDLRSKPWIPTEDEEGITHYPPNPELLRQILDPSWLEGNSDGAELLVRHFGMDALDVRLLAAAKDEAGRQRLRDSLARIVEIAGDNPQVIEYILAKAEQQRRDVSRMRDLGLAVQEQVKVALERLGLKVEDIDRGYDFLVTAVNVREDAPEDLSAYFQVGEYKVEVKATAVQDVRLTPLQAATAAAAPEEFVLCVVDLRSFKEDVHQANWASEDVASRCRFTSGQSLPIEDTLMFVRSAEVSDVPIRNAAALRYAVPAGLWENGLRLDQWVQSAFGQ